MPRYYCDYCDIYLTHDSQSARKEHNNGRTHKANVRSYYQQFEAQRNQTLIDQKIKEHMGKVSAAYNHMRPYIAPFPTPMMPMNSQWMSVIRPPPMLPTPLPGYVSGPHVPPMMAPPGGGASHFTSQSSSYGSGIASIPTGGGGGSHSMANFVTYQSNTAASGGFDGGSQASEDNSRW